MKLIAPSQGLVEQIVENARLIAEAIEVCGSCELAVSRSRNLKVFAVRKNQWHARSNPQSSSGDEGGLA